MPYQRKHPPRRVIGFGWTDTSRSALDKRRAARELVAVLSGEPQPAVDAPIVLRTAPEIAVADRPASWRPAQTDHPISYREAAERFSWVGVDWDGESLPTQPGDDAAGLDENPEAGRGDLADLRVMPDATRTNEPTRPAAGRRKKPSIPYTRPGRGGRQPSVKAFSATSATEELYEKYGEPVPRAASGGAHLLIWELDRKGTGIVAARLSSRDVQGGETAMGQVHPCLDMCERHELKPRLIVVATNMSGTRDLDERDDIILIESAIEAGWCKFVAFRDGDRVAREIVPAELFYRLLRKTRTDLYIAHTGRKVDWVRDRLQLRASSMVSAEERDNTTRRMQIAALNQYPLQGKGWGGHSPFGTYRDKKKNIRVAKESWYWINRGFFEYAQMGDGSTGSFRKLEEKLAAEGCRFDHDRWRTLLQNPFYVTGEFTINVRGIPVAQRPVEIPEGYAVPPQIFQRVQSLLSLRQGRTEQTALGEYALNYVECIHARCAHERKARGKDTLRPLIKGYNINGKPGRYRHGAFVPACCTRRGYTWDRETLERPVIEAVRELARSPELQDEWARRAQWDEPARLPDPAEVRERMEAQIVSLERQKDRLKRNHLERAAAGEDLSPDEITEFLGDLNREIKQVRTRLDAEQAMRDLDGESPLGRRNRRRLEAFEEILTVELPEDAELRKLRAELLQKCVSQVIVHEDDKGDTWLELRGPLVPDGAPRWEKLSPLNASGVLLDGYIAERDQDDADDDAEVAAWKDLVAAGPPDEEAESGSNEDDEGTNEESESDLEPRAFKSLSKDYADLWYRPSTKQVRNQKAASRHSWRQRSFPLPYGGVPAWESAPLPLPRFLPATLAEIEARLPQLPWRYRRAMRLILAGKRTPEIAAELGLSRRTVVGYVAESWSLLGLHGPGDLPKASAYTLAPPAERAEARNATSSQPVEPKGPAIKCPETDADSVRRLQHPCTTSPDHSTTHRTINPSTRKDSRV